MYRVRNNRDTVQMRAEASTGPAATAEEWICWMILEPHPANSAARTYFQTAASMGLMPSCIGRPAYQSAGSVRIQKDAVQAIAIPTGPQGSATTNNSSVTAASMNPHRNQRSGLPRER